MNAASFIPPLLALTFSPLLPGTINRVKAFFAGRKGPPLLQGYYDLARLLRKGAVYSRTTSWVFRAGPIVSLAALLLALLLTPLGTAPAPLAFDGDVFLFLYLLGLGRFFTMLAALDTGSAFEGMGASREAQFSVFVEPALLLALVALARHAGAGWSLSAIYGALTPGAWPAALPLMALLASALMVTWLAENARVPVDDPNTHLELTMIHEVMALDHGGVDFLFIVYGAGLKLWIVGALVAGVLFPFHTGRADLDALAGTAGLLLLAAAAGALESIMARLRLTRVPQLLVGAGVLSALALLLSGW